MKLNSNTLPHGVDRLQRQANAERRCCFEQMEPRVMLSANSLAEGDSVSSAALGAPYVFTGGLTGSISGSVFAVSAGDCDAHSEPLGLPQVSVQLLSPAGLVLEELVTDAQGDYHFADLIPGRYEVRELTPSGFFEGEAHIGDGGGVVFDTNHMGEIIVQASQSLTGYDFCESTSLPDPTGTIGQPNIPQVGETTQIAPILHLSMQSAVAKQTEQPVKSSMSASMPHKNHSANLAPVPFVSQSVNVFRDAAMQSTRRTSEPVHENQEDWHSKPLEDWDSSVSYWELASTNQAASEALESLLVDLVERSDTNASERDAICFDEYSAQSQEWWQGQACFDLEASQYQENPMIAADTTYRVQTTPRLARRFDTANSAPPKSTPQMVDQALAEQQAMPTQH